MILEFKSKENKEYRDMISQIILLVEKWDNCTKHELMRDIIFLKHGIEKYKDKFVNAGYENSKFVLQLAEQAFVRRFMHERRRNKVA